MLNVLWREYDVVVGASSLFQWRVRDQAPLLNDWPGRPWVYARRCVRPAAAHGRRHGGSRLVQGKLQRKGQGGASHPPPSPSFCALIDSRAAAPRPTDQGRDGGEEKGPLRGGQRERVSSSSQSHDPSLALPANGLCSRKGQELSTPV